MPVVDIMLCIYIEKWPSKFCIKRIYYSCNFKNNEGPGH